MPGQAIFSSFWTERIRHKKGRLHWQSPDRPLQTSGVWRLIAICISVIAPFICWESFKVADARTDEFIIALPADKKADFDSVVDNWSQSISGINVAQHTDIKIKCSGGYLIGRGSSEEELRCLVRKADETLYEAKRKGKDRVCFYNK